MTADNQSAYLQIGERVPQITATSVTANSQQNQVTLENVGTMLGLTAPSPTKTR